MSEYMYMLFDTATGKYVETTHNISFTSVSAAKNAYLSTQPYNSNYRRTWERCKSAVKVVRVKISEIKGEFID
jgi:hypothetical protein